MNDWLDLMKPGDLPIFRRTREVIAAMSDRREELTARELAAEILVDPLASYQLLRAINKKVGERYGTEVATVEHGLMMQGIGVYIDAARRLPVIEESAAARDPYTLGKLRALTRRVQHAAWQARDFAVLHADIRAEEVQVAALLHYLPEFLLLLRAPATARRLYRERRRGGADEAEQRVLGTTLRALRLPLLESWSIPATSLDLLGTQHGDRARQVMLKASLDIAERAERGWWDAKLMADYSDLAGVENTPIEIIIATAHANAARAARACDWLPATAAAAWMPLIPGVWPLDEDDEVEPVDKSASLGQAPATPEPPAPAVPAAPSKAAMPAPAPAPDATKTPDEAAPALCPMPDKQVFQQTLKGIEAHLDGSYTLNQMSAVILKGLHNGLGLSRILFAMPTPDGTRVKSRFTLGIAADDALRQFDFPLGAKDMFGQLMAKMQGVWLNEGNRAKLWPMIDPRLQKMIGEGEFFAMSLYQGDKPLGLIYADRGHGACGLDPLTYTDFKMLCIQAARGLGKVKPAA